MKNKTPLMLIEQVVMILVLAIASAVCVRAFLWANQKSAAQIEKDNAYICAQSAAELLKHCQGEHFKVANKLDVILLGNYLRVNYDENWQICPESSKYVLYSVPIPTENPLLGKERVTVASTDGNILAELEVAYQKEVPHE